MVKLRAYFVPFGQGSFYLLATIILGVSGWYLQHKAFTPPPPAGQMYAAVFVRDPAVHVSLSAKVYPDEPWTDSLTVTVSDTSHKQPGWLLVIECPAGAPSQKPAVHLDSESVPQTQSSVTQVTVYSGITSPRPNTLFHCFPPPGTSPGPLGTPGYSPSLANVSLPALQLDQGIIGAQAAPVLYAQQDHPGGAVGQLIQIFPGAVCPSPTTAPVQATASPGATSASPVTTPSPGTTSASPVTTSSPQPSAPASLSPTITASPIVPENSNCFAQAPAATKFIPYELPSLVTTTETLNHMDTRGYQISMFPVGNTVEENGERPGQIAKESVTWSGRSGLNPSLDATNQAAESAASHDTFIAGVFFGVASGTAVAFVDGLWETLRGKKEEASNGDQTGDTSGKHDDQQPDGGRSERDPGQG